jgi:hypothetical protein
MSTNNADVISASDALEAAIADAERLRSLLKRGSTLQVRAAEEKAVARATALAWFNSYRGALSTRVDSDRIEELDGKYRHLLNASSKATTRGTYDDMLKAVRKMLLAERAGVAVPLAPLVPRATNDTPPNFGALVPDAAMQRILERRWRECSSCLGAGAPLAATVMMGGLLEGLLLAKVNAQGKPAAVFTAKAAPRDRKSGQTLALAEWTLKHYIDVAHELQWISQSARDVGNVLRDYRNYVHPQKELSHGVVLANEDALLLWEVSKNIARQLL